MRNDYDELETYNYDNNDYNEYNKQMTMTYDDLNRLIGSKVRGSMIWMVIGLLITGGIGFMVYNGANNGNSVAFMIVEKYWIFLILEVVAVLAFSALVYTANSSVLKLIFLIYSALSGLTFSVIGLRYAPDVIGSAFLGTLSIFVVLAVYGYFTKENLTRFVPLLTAGIIAMILVSVVNMFLGNSAIDLFVSVLGVIIFTVYIAVDVNRIRNNIIACAVHEDADILNKIEIVGALELYLDFVNLFLSLVRILGRKR